MNGTEILRIVDAIHRDKAIDAEIVFEGIEQAILSAARKHFSEEEQLEVRIDRESGEPALICDGRMLDPELLGDLLGRISAQTAKQVMIQKIREAERDTLYEEYLELRSQLISGQVTRVDRGTVIVSLGKVEAILPRSEQIRKENYRTGDRVRAIVLDVRKAGSRVRVILSRTHADFVRRLFEVEIPEVNDRVIEVRSIAREAGNRSKVAVSCGDASIDCVGACVGVRGARIRGIVEELAGERIDIVRWNDSLSILVPNALQPAEVEDVILCPMLGKVIVLVREDQLSLAIGKFGQNVRLASKLVGWDINVMTQDLLDQQLALGILVLPEDGVVMHVEFRETFLLQRVHDRLRAELRALGLFDDRVFLVHLFSQLGISLHELDHLVSLPLAVGRLCNEEHSVGKLRAVELLFRQLSFKSLDERLDMRWKRRLRFKL